MANWPIVLLAVMITVLLTTRTRMPSVCAIGALSVLVLSGRGEELISKAAPNAVLVLVVMSAVQLAVGMVLEAGATEWASVAIARATASRSLRGIPAPVLLPLLFVPLTAISAAFLHNITSILLLAPLAIAVYGSYRVSPMPTLCAMLSASNLGGASTSFGDTPAIVMRGVWGFGPATFAGAMLPRNLIILALLTALATLMTWWPERANGTGPRDTMERLRRRDGAERDRRYRPVQWREMGIGLGSLAVFLLLQFLLPQHSLVIGSALLAGLLLLRHDARRVDGLVVLGLEAIIVIVSIFVVASTVELTPAVAQLVAYLRQHPGGGLVEMIAFGLTSGVSADGAAATLAPIVHTACDGSLLGALQLQSGICAGSSALLTAASAGPVLNAVSKASGCEVTFRGYAKFGVPFALLMLAVYVLYNLMAGG